MYFKAAIFIFVATWLFNLARADPDIAKNEWALFGYENGCPADPHAITLGDPHFLAREEAHVINECWATISGFQEGVKEVAFVAWGLKENGLALETYSDEYCLTEATKVWKTSTDAVCQVLPVGTTFKGYKVVKA